MHTKICLSNFVPLLALPAVFLTPEFGKIFFPYTSWILGAMLFFAFLGLNLNDLLKAARKPKEILYVSLVVLVLTPLIIYPIMQRFFPEYALGAFLFMLLPSAVSSPAVASLYGGNVAKSMMNVVASSLLSPLTIPLMLVLFVGTGIAIPAMIIFQQLVLIVLLPFVLGLLANRYAENLILRVKKYYRPINLFLIFLLFFGALSPYAIEMKTRLLDAYLWLAVLVTYIVLYFFAELFMLHENRSGNRIAIKSNLLFLNVGLGVVLAQNYFGPSEMLFIIFCEIVWVVLVGFFKYLK